MNFRVEIEQEKDGRWIAEVVDLPGFSPMGALRKRLKQKFKLLLFVS
jgi:predicted RNase H-like HicB family nuclease